MRCLMLADDGLVWHDANLVAVNSMAIGPCDMTVTDVDHKWQVWWFDQCETQTNLKL